MKNQSVWNATESMEDCLPLQESLDTDVCIIGAGIAGLSTAYLLALEGKKVIVLEDGQLAGGMTSVTTAHLATALDRRYCQLEHWHGADGARLVAASHAAAIDKIEANIAKERIQCHFQRLDGYLFLGPEDDEKLLDRELAAVHRAGLSQVRKLARVPNITSEARPCLEFPQQAQFHPLKYLNGLVAGIRRAGGRLFCNTHVDHVESAKPAQVQAGNHVVSARWVVIATNTPINNLVVIHTKLAPYMTYVLATRIPKGSLQKALYWDTHDPFHYVRLQSAKDHDLLIVGGEDHKTGQMKEFHDPYAKLNSWARLHFPMVEQIEFTWAGQIMESMDGLGFIGNNPLDSENIFVITGDSGMGMTHGTIGSMLITDLVLGRENPWTSLYDPARKTLRAAGTFAKETLNMAAQYTDWVTGGDVGSPDEIPRDTGAVLRRGMTKIAAYRDEAGVLHQFSAVCPHLGCIVHWNPLEKTWDCPCHGSRFGKLGKVINGPANQPLSPATQG